jgi:hypothetical protein
MFKGLQFVRDEMLGSLFKISSPKTSRPNGFCKNACVLWFLETKVDENCLCIIIILRAVHGCFLWLG